MRAHLGPRGNVKMWLAAPGTVFGSPCGRNPFGRQPEVGPPGGFPVLVRPILARLAEAGGPAAATEHGQMPGQRQHSALNSNMRQVA
mmetsp:Transcript_2610/g.5201  ORF Transcript_2610/g.5201 Transcript_2610/m.5201 type:complete len:87 (-) Transcript_2610:567-827(-)